MRKSIKKSIEEEENPKLEHSYIKYPGKSPISISKDRTESSVNDNWQKARGIWKENNKKTYTHIHTHPYGNDEDIVQDKYFKILPSDNDLIGFLHDDTEKTMVIAQQDTETKEVYGYFVIKKTNKTPKSGYSRVKKESLFNRTLNKLLGPDIASEEIVKDVDNTIYKIRNASEGAYRSVSKEALDELSEKYGLKYKIISTTGDKELYAVKKKKGLEHLISLTAIFTFAGIFILFSNNITGNVINLDGQLYIKEIGIIFVLIILIFIFYIYHKSKNKRVK